MSNTGIEWFDKCVSCGNTNLGCKCIEENTAKTNAKMEESKNESLLPSVESIFQKNNLFWIDLSKEEMSAILVTIKEAMEITRDKTAEHIIENGHWFTSGVEYLESLKTSDKLKVH